MQAKQSRLSQYNLVLINCMKIIIVITKTTVCASCFLEPKGYLEQDNVSLT